MLHLYAALVTGWNELFVIFTVFVEVREAENDDCLRIVIQ